MITKGQITGKRKDNLYQVRIALYDKFEKSNNATLDKNLIYAPCVIMPGQDNMYQKGDIVWIGFEENYKDRPIILGSLFSPSVNKNIGDINVNKLQVNSESILPKYTQIGEVKWNELQMLSNLKGNIQSQINGLREGMKDNAPEWGSISGNIKDQNDLVNELLKYPLKSDLPTKLSDFSNEGENPFLRKDIADNSYIKKEDIQDNLISDDANKPLSANQGKALKALIDGQEYGKSFDSIEDMVIHLNGDEGNNLDYRVAFNFLIIDIESPNFWITEVLDNHVPYNYTYDSVLINEIEEAPVQIGYYKISLTDTAKIDLLDYVKKEEGKVLSTNDYTDVDKDKVDKIKTDGEGNKAFLDNGTYGEVGKVDSVNNIVPDGNKNITITTDNITEGAINKFVTLTEKGTWNSYKNVQVDWDEVDTEKDEFIKNKPTDLGHFNNKIIPYLSEDIADQRYALKLIESNLYIDKVTNNEAHLVSEKPEVKNNNYLSSTTTNTNIDLEGDPEFILNYNLIEELNLTSFDILKLKLPILSDTEESQLIKFKIRVKTDTAGEIKTISGDSEFNVIFPGWGIEQEGSQGSPFKALINAVFDLPLDLISGEDILNLKANDTLIIEIFKSQAIETPLTTRILCGVQFEDDDRYGTLSIMQNIGKSSIVKVIDGFDSQSSTEASSINNVYKLKYNLENIHNPTGGGFQGGYGSISLFGAAIGQNAKAEIGGGAVGYLAEVIDGGGAVGDWTYSDYGGGAVGLRSKTYLGGGTIGIDTYSDFGGGAVGHGATAYGKYIDTINFLAGGGAVGFESSSTMGGGAIGSNTKALEGGGAVGHWARASNSGGAIGASAITSSGFAGGAGAKTIRGEEEEPIDAIQLGTGINDEPWTLQIYSHRLMNADGSLNIGGIKLSNPSTGILRIG